jgi:hypothetical protein
LRVAKKSTRAIAPKSAPDLPLRITVKRPPRGVMFCVQGKPGEYLSQTRSTDADIVFDIEVRAAGEPPRLLGAVVQGPPAQRFVYVCSGTYAGDSIAHSGRRAKVPLVGITSALIAKRRPGMRLAAEIQGTAGDGGPACATVQLLGSGWAWKA